jgi:plasmid stabilization system protein ParE
MVGCAVFGCSNSQRTPNINLYLIPNDNRRSEYIRRLGRADKRDDRRWRICSAHFCDSAFERNALHEYVYVNGCKRLSTIALPTENLPPTVKIQSAAATPRSERFAKRRQTDEARRYRQELSERVESLQNQLDIANSENRKLRLKLQHAERSNSYYNRRVRRAILVQQCKSRTVSKLRYSLARVSSSLAKSFTRGQLQVLQHGKRYARWTDTEIAKAIVFRKISRRGYNFVRKRMNLPLPHGSTLVRWSRCIPAAPGFVPAACILFDTIVELELVDCCEARTVLSSLLRPSRCTYMLKCCFEVSSTYAK